MVKNASLNLDALSCFASFYNELSSTFAAILFSSTLNFIWCEL